ncbi:MAG: chemotaxis protein CheW [Syntrophobacter sp.]
MSEGHIDWSAIRLRLAAINAEMAKGFSPGPEERKRILKARADLLARRSDMEKDGDSIEVVEFLLANEHYGVESGYVREVYPLREYTPLPCTPKFVLGLINVRGLVVSVIDIGKFFDLPAKGITDLNQVIIIQDRAMRFGILADSISGIREISVQDLQPSLPTLKGIREEYLRGITPERLVVLDARKLLSDGKIVVHEEA